MDPNVRSTQFLVEGSSVQQWGRFSDPQSIKYCQGYISSKVARILQRILCLTGVYKKIKNSSQRGSSMAWRTGGGATAFFFTVFLFHKEQSSSKRNECKVSQTMQLKVSTVLCHKRFLHPVKQTHGNFLGSIVNLCGMAWQSFICCRSPIPIRIIV